MTLDRSLLAPLEEMTPDLQDQWRRRCYLRSAVHQLCVEADRSVVILCPPGAGLSTELALLPSYGLLSFSYNPDQWPGAAHVFTNAPTHFEQWLGYIAQRFTNRLRDQPDLVPQLTRNNLELILWLTHRYRSERARDTLFQRLRINLADDDRDQIAAKIQHPSFQQLYGSNGSERAALIEECVEIAAILGWKGIYAAIDISWTEWASRSADERRQLSAAIRDLLSTLSPLQVPGFGIKMGLSTTVDLTEGEIRSLIRGRAVVAHLSWSATQIRDLAQRYLVATGVVEEGAQPFFGDADWATLSGDIQAIWGDSGPAAATAIVAGVHEIAHPTAAPAERSPKQATPDERLSALRRYLYSQCGRLWLDPNRDLRTIWRGAVTISFEETPFRFMERLWRDRGNPVGNEILMPIAGHSAGNLDKNINRMREKLEPFYGTREHIYIQRVPNQGPRLMCYWQDNQLKQKSETHVLSSPSSNP